MPSKSQNNLEFHELSAKQQEILDETFDYGPESSSARELILIGDKKYVYAKKCQTDGEEFFNFEGKPDDIWVFTVTRSGTTWTVEMLWLLMNNLNYDGALSERASKRIPYFESPLTMGEEIKKLAKDRPEENQYTTYSSELSSRLDHIKTMKSPRLIKTHLPLSLLPNVASRSKIVYVARNPKDLAVSNYHFMKSFKINPCKTDFEGFWNAFENGLAVGGTPYWEHVKEGWERRDDPNFLFIFYEEMIEDLLGVVKRVANFVGKSYSEEEYKKLCDYLSFSNIKKNKMVNFSVDPENAGNKVLFQEGSEFVRTGKKQAWSELFTPSLNAKANRWIEENLKNTDLQFPFVDIYA